MTKESEKAVILDDIPVTMQVDEVTERLRLGKRGPSLKTMVEDVLEQVVRLAKPKALFKPAYIGGRGESKIEIDGIEFKSSILVRNLADSERVFPYIVTAGRELEKVDAPKSDMMRVFIADAMKELVLEKALRFFESRLSERYALGTMSHMNPGSLNDWPVSQQKFLFSLFGDVEDLIGVRLTPSYLMDPIKSVSGIYFPTEIRFESCMLCTRGPCPKRRSPYNPEMAKKYRGEKVT